MTSKHSPAAGGVEPSSPVPDDFKLINGIGPAIEQCLHQADILTFAQLAALSPASVASVVAGLAGLSAKRIAQQDWIGQARELAPEPAPTKLQAGTTAPGDRQHYATFTVELLLDESNDVRRTRVAHIQGGGEESWVGWQDGRLADFFVQHAALRLPPIEPAVQEVETAQSTPQVAASPEPTPPPPVTTNPASVLRLRELEIISTEANSRRNILYHNQSFDMHLTLDLTEITPPDDTLLDYTAIVYAKSLSGGPPQIVGEARGAITAVDSITIKVKGAAPPRGIYRLEASVTLMLLSQGVNLTAFLESGLLQIY